MRTTDDGWGTRGTGEVSVRLYTHRYTSNHDGYEDENVEFLQIQKIITKKSRGVERGCAGQSVSGERVVAGDLVCFDGGTIAILGL